MHYSAKLANATVLVLLISMLAGGQAPSNDGCNNEKQIGRVVSAYAPKGLEEALGFPPRQATLVSSWIHTPPSGFGKIMAEVQPRMAVGYHTIRRPELDQMMLDEIRKTYDGPLAIADDLMCWNITKDSIVQREVVSAERVAAPPTTEGYKKAERSGKASYSKFIDEGKWEAYTPPPLPKE